jgi:hypothetical protein
MRPTYNPFTTFYFLQQLKKSLLPPHFYLMVLVNMSSITLDLDESSLLYRSGDAFFSERIKRFLGQYIVGDDTTLFYLNLWSINHFLSGVVVGFARIGGPFFAFVLHTVWEIWQIIIGMTPLNLRGVIDTFVDTIVYMLGFYLFNAMV